MSSNPLFSTWLGGRLPSSSNAASPGAQIVRRRIRQGRQTRVKTKDDLEGTKYFYSFFIAQLDCALVDRAIELQVLHETRPMPERLVSLIHDLVAVVIKSNDATTRHKGKKPPRTLKSAEQLFGPLVNFKYQVAQVIPVSEWGLLLCTVLNDLIEDIEHFVRNIRITSGIVMVSEGQPKVRNRPTNRVAQRAYASIIAEHMALHGPDKSLKPAEVQRRLQLLGHTVNDRTLRDWKHQIEKNVMGDYVQVRKRQ